ncbi:hypothetical protein BCV72DRAFT_322966 [Rhizopus microsporus var. microsporus]|uniref:Uncharacterized protein n=2 Tax=Rhizopus microsporus TaxID=58291 RepID=A0A2G4SXJ1_RHIZD|nr:uncharacterized protein RHIMIDRAFT_120425 [Rhizopus microsporus ATCC 52813]ORE01131.1 hypothetical protein BCV72DRAFT_322966 [Rhizopus microsporus var. microsporus]PHZ13464.1 hypothetical protein RHIMIDRAFT_120425 [Rhizopus microsporus ATCC 52813]
MYSVLYSQHLVISQHPLILQFFKARRKIQLPYSRVTRFRNLELTTVDSPNQKVWKQ